MTTERLELIGKTSQNRYASVRLTGDDHEDALIVNALYGSLHNILTSEDEPRSAGERLPREKGVQVVLASVLAEAN